MCVDSTRKEFSRVSDAVRDCNTQDKLSSMSPAALTAPPPSSTMESALRMSGLARTQRLARITSASGARLLPATATTELSASRSKRTSPLAPWAAKSELCFTPTSRSELSWTNSAQSLVEARACGRQSSSGKHDVDPFPELQTSAAYEPSGSLLFNLDFRAFNTIKLTAMSLLLHPSYLSAWYFSSLASIFPFNLSILFII